MNSAPERAAESKTLPNHGVHAKTCWPATPRDWLTAHTRIRLGRFDRFSGVREFRARLITSLAREDHSIRFATEYGFDVHLPASYRGYIDMALAGQLFHTTLTAVTKENIRPGDIVIDGGSNVGFFALLAAKLLNGSGRVFAFEAEPDTFSLLRRNIARNGLAIVVQAEEQALADRDGTCDFFVDSEDPMMSSVVSCRPASFRAIRTRTISLDSYVATSRLGRVDVVKLDLEGGEPACIRGMQESIRGVRCLIMEVDPQRLERQRISAHQFVDEVRDSGRFDEVWVCDEERGRLLRWESEAAVERVFSRCGYANLVLRRKAV